MDEGSEDEEGEKKENRPENKALVGGPDWQQDIQGDRDEHPIADQAGQKPAIHFLHDYFFGASRLSAVNEATSMTRIDSS